jgi:methyl-accepting chemotaxis protein
MNEPLTEDVAPKSYVVYRTIRQRLTLVFSCLMALSFCVFAFVYFQIGTFQTALSGALIALALILVLEGFIIFRRMAEHIERLSGTMEQAESGKLKQVQGAGDTRELAIIADTFNRTLSKLEETARDLGIKAIKASTLHEIREIVPKTIHMEEVAKVILERAIGVMSLAKTPGLE